MFSLCGNYHHLEFCGTKLVIFVNICGVKLIMIKMHCIHISKKIIFM